MIKHARFQPALVDLLNDAERVLGVRQRVAELVQRKIHLPQIIQRNGFAASIAYFAPNGDGALKMGQRRIEEFVLQRLLQGESLMN